MHAARLKVQLSATPFSDHSAIRTVKLKKNLGTYGIIAGDDTIVQNMYGELKNTGTVASREIRDGLRVPCSLYHTMHAVV